MSGGSIFGAVAPNQVVFDVTERCRPDATFDCDPAKFNSANSKHWPDAPQDCECKPGAVCNVHSPSYWSTKRLTTITTQYNQGTGPVKVDEYRLAQQFPHVDEPLDRQRWRTRIELANVIFEYLEIFHNRQRRHSALGMLTPIEIDSTKPRAHHHQTRMMRTDGPTEEVSIRAA